jgi:hypothetical protein
MGDQGCIEGTEELRSACSICQSLKLKVHLGNSRLGVWNVLNWLKIDSNDGFL